MVWSKVTDDTARRKILKIVNEGIQRLDKPAKVQKDALALIEQRKKSGKDYIPWSPLDLARGFSGFCLLFANLDRFDPEGGFDTVGHSYMLEMQKALMQQENQFGLGLWTGIPGVIMAAKSLSRNGERYQSVTKELNSYFINTFPSMLAYMETELERGISVQDYDVIQGVSGMGRYLLCFLEQPEMRSALEQILSFLIKLCEDKTVYGITAPGWYISYDKFTAYNREDYPNGHFNCGMSHGISGILALMSLSWMKGVEVQGQHETITKIAAWLMKWKQEDEFGPIWPSRISFEEFREGKLNNNYSRAAWCYGDAGVARAVWLSGMALTNDEWKLAALNTFKAIAARPEEKWHIESHTLCHGYAGLLQMVQRMYSESNDKLIGTLRDRLLEKVLNLWNPKEPYGFHEGEPSDIQYISGLLDGAAGVLTVLIGLIQENDSEWDNVFLIS